MTQLWTCPKCNRSYPHTGGNIRCICKEKVNNFVCRYRKSPIQNVDCGCNGTAVIYQCEKYNQCSIRKIPKGNFCNVKICLDCDDREHFQPKRIGFALVGANKVGGVETWLKSLIDDDVSGVSTVDEPSIDDIGVPVIRDAFDELADNSEIVFVWGVTRPLPQGPLYVAVHHGDLNSSWANSVFRAQSKWCKAGVAINPEVAKHYGVLWRPNPIDPLRGLAKNLPTIDRNYKYVLWNHRVASEKRPDLALQIAEALPDGWKLIFSGEPRNESPKVLYAGQIQNPGDWIGVSHVFLSTSDQEGFGYSMAEAITAGVPVVSSPFGIGQDYYPEFVCRLDAPIEKWVEKIVQAYKFPFDEAIHRAEKLIRLHGIECKKLWREIKKPS